mmetsp:Transcript_8125/g.23080  ORF Transcript_8125/g.23080 Transcript_8125/m.23080 type:complete len:283 (+) Transcript_8125:167-1015(+)
MSLQGPSTYSLLKRLRLVLEQSPRVVCGETVRLNGKFILTHVHIDEVKNVLRSLVCQKPPIDFAAIRKLKAQLRCIWPHWRLRLQLVAFALQVGFFRQFLGKLDCRVEICLRLGAFLLCLLLSLLLALGLRPLAVSLQCSLELHVLLLPKVRRLFPAALFGHDSRQFFLGARHEESELVHQVLCREFAFHAKRQSLVLISGFAHHQRNEGEGRWLKGLHELERFGELEGPSPGYQSLLCKVPKCVASQGSPAEFIRVLVKRRVEVDEEELPLVPSQRRGLPE